MSLFEQAARMKLRYDTSIGVLSVEDLWDLPLRGTGRRNNLDTIAIELHSQIKTESISFVDTENGTDKITQLKFDIVKHVIDTRKAEIKAQNEAQTKADNKEKILALIARKKDAAMEEKSIEELEGLLATL